MEGATIVDGDNVKKTVVTSVEAPAMESSKDGVQLPSEKGEQAKRPEKFKTDQDVYKAYAELEKKLGEQSKEIGELRGNKKAPAEAITDDKGLTITPAEEALAKKGISMADLETEFSANKGLKDETYKRLEEVGFNKADVDGYIAEKIRLGELESDKFAADVLKQANLKADQIADLKEWAGKNLSKDELELFNETVKSGNAKKAAAVLKMVDTQYRQSVGREGSMIHGGAAGSAVLGYASDAEMLKDMGSPDYNNDPAYRAKVQAKIAASMKKRK